MSRLSPILSVVCLFLCFSFVSAQEPMENLPPLKSTPDVLQQAAEARQVIEKLPLEQKVTAYFELMSLQMRFEDKTPVRETVAAILKLVPAIDKVLMQQQILETIVFAQTDIGDYEGALETVDRIAKAATRASGRFSVAEKMSADMAQNPGAAVPVLEKGVAEAVEANNAGMEAVVRATLGRELARTGKIDEAKAQFAAARKKAREIEAVEERNVVAMIIRSEIQVGMVPDALAILASITDEEMKQHVTGYAAVVLLQEGKTEEANKLIESMPPGDYRDRVLMGIVQETAKTITVEKVRELANRLSTPDRKEMFLQSALHILLESDRLEEVAELAKPMGNPKQVQAAIQVRQLEKLLAEKKFDEAQKLTEGFDDEQTKQLAIHYVLMSRLRVEKFEDVQKQAEATFSETQRQQIEQLRQESDKAAEVEGVDPRMAALTEVMRAQFGLFDLLGARKTMDRLLEALNSIKDPGTVVEYRQELAKLQLQLGDKEGVRKNLDRLLQYLDGIKDLKTLEKLVTEPQDEEAPQPGLVVKAAVSEEEIKDRLFNVYVGVVNILGHAGDVDGTKKPFEKAKQLAETDPDEMKKTEKLLRLTQLIAEIETPEMHEK